VAAWLLVPFRREMGGLISHGNDTDFGDAHADLGKLGRQLHRQIARLGSFQDPSHLETAHGVTMSSISC
jgi:hypothetical protein